MIQHILDINVGLKDILDNTFGLFKNIVSLEFEKTFTKFILMKKKKYTGLLSMKDGKNIAKIFSRGTEDAKKTSIKLSKQTYLELVNIIFTNNSDQNVIEYIEKLRDHIYNDDIDLKDILLITRVSKPIASYKSLTLAGRLADRLIKEGKLLPIVESEKKVGTRLEYIVTKINDKNEGILLEEVNNNWNRDYYWEVQIFAPLKRVLDCTHPHIDWSKYDIQKIKKVRIKKNDTTKIDTIRRSR
jgi:DNA polymerase elongation subunit (family B)